MFSCAASPVHPRACGERVYAPPRLTEFRGSSPRVRGTVLFQPCDINWKKTWPEFYRPECEGACVLFGFQRSSSWSASLGRNETSLRPSKSVGTRRFSPAVSRSKPDSLLACQAMTALPVSRPARTCDHIISRTFLDTSPTYTPARTSSSQMASRPRSRSGAFSSTMTSITDRLGFREGGRNRFRRRRGTVDATGRQHVFDEGDQSIKDLRRAEGVSARKANRSFWAF